MLILTGESGERFTAELENPTSGATTLTFKTDWCSGTARVFLNDGEYARLADMFSSGKNAHFLNELGSLEVTMSATGPGRMRAEISIIPDMAEDGSVKFAFIALHP
ncbi:hypothetical protein J2T09_002948 [Neorhizobium huautlense]|uniref:Uncharacterized protein n=1 Tax=Neorhizobium huautlense TaxID=67774 RepID=A0ABT9PUN7_9HYPH|nr:hypothetical protein [Neorhizobium huautlense]MDP9838181.1 hypothetical protein [Neorhizobium huautlense]